MVAHYFNSSTAFLVLLNERTEYSKAMKNDQKYSIVQKTEASDTPVSQLTIWIEGACHDQTQCDFLQR